MKITLRNFAIAKIIVFELFEQWTMLTVFLFLVLIISIGLTIKPNSSPISKKHDGTSIFVVGVLLN